LPLFLRRAFLALVAVDSLLTGLWLVFVPAGLFHLLKIPPSDVVLSQGLGLLFLAHVSCLVLAAGRPANYRALALVPLLGRALLAALWTWLLLSERVTPYRPALYGLLALALVWLPGLAWTLRGPSPARSEPPDNVRPPSAGERVSTP
jgi:hypothetical protein